MSKNFSSPCGRETHKIISDFLKTQQPDVEVLSASAHLDYNEATDLVGIIHESRYQIARRVRGLYAMENLAWRWQYTFRVQTPNDRETEIHKIRDGNGDFYFYGFGEDGVGIKRWTIFSLDRWRIHDLNGTLGRCWKVPNNDGTAGMAWDFRSTPDIILAASYRPPSAQLKLVI